MMKDKIIRIPLVGAILHDWEISRDFAADTKPVTPDVSEDGSSSAGSSTSVAASPDELDFNFSLKPCELQGWTASRSGFPSAKVDFAFPAADFPRVLGWFTGNFEGVTSPASSALLRSVSEACERVLTRYVADATAADLFTAPFRVGWAFRYKNGSRKMLRVPELLCVARESPALAIDSFHIAETSAASTVDIRHHPCSLVMTPSKPSAAGFAWGDIAYIDIIAAPQASIVPKTISVTGTTTVIEGANRFRTYRYNRLNEDAVAGDASMQNDFRILCSIPVSSLNGTDKLDIVPATGALAHWKNLAKYNTGSTGGDSDYPDDPDKGWEPYVDKITDALDLGMPESRKWIRRVELRGNFRRNGGLKISLYGSRHRQDWHLIASGTNGWCSALSASGYRWFRVRITGPLDRHHFFDALSFRISRTRE